MSPVVHASQFKPLPAYKRGRETRAFLAENFKRRMAELTLLDRPVVCPAGEKIAEAMGGVACRCRVTHSSIRSRVDPSSLERFCMADATGVGVGYQACPVWRAEKERATATPLVEPTDED